MGKPPPEILGLLVRLSRAINSGRAHRKSGRYSSADGVHNIVVLAGNLFYAGQALIPEIAEARPNVNPKTFAFRVAAALSLSLILSFSGGVVGAKRMPQDASQTRGAKLKDDSKTKIASETNGRYYALVIGINNYKNLPKLTTATADAQALATLLQTQYGFETTVLLDATRDQISKALNDYRRNLDENANLLIYYAGHGIYDKVADKAYWMPVDAESDDNSHWIMADDITTELKVIPARHILIISDSCYSGGLTREVTPALSKQERDRFLDKMILGKSRTLMSSGALEPVSDTGGGGHSVFTGALLHALATTTDSIFPAEGVFDEYIQVSVAGRSDQTPQYSPVRNSGHDSGDFVFVRSGQAPPPGPAPKNSRVQPAISQVPPPEPGRPPAAPGGRADHPNQALFQSLAGEYDFGAIVDSISVNSDGALMSLLPGQPQYELQPTGDLQFNVIGAPGFSAEFRRDANGEVTELISHQPAATFTGERRSGQNSILGS